MATTYSQSLTASQTSSKERTAVLANRSSATRAPMATINEPAATLVIFLKKLLNLTFMVF